MTDGACPHHHADGVDAADGPEKVWRCVACGARFRWVAQDAFFSVLEYVGEDGDDEPLRRRAPGAGVVSRGFPRAAGGGVPQRSVRDQPRRGAAGDGAAELRGDGEGARPWDSTQTIT